VLVTGGAGFIGSHLVEALLGAGHEVRVLDALLPSAHPGGARPFRGDQGFEFTRGDVRDAQAVDKALRGVGAVCHLAAMVGLGVDFDDAPLYAGCNDLGTAVLLAAMARAKASRLVVASSMVVYGEGAYSCAGHGLAATPPPRQAADLDAGRFEPRCERCGGPLKPEVVLFGEILAAEPLRCAQQLCERAELLLCIGSSLEVHPVAGLPLLTHDAGGAVAILTRGSTPLDGLASVRLSGDVVDELQGLLGALGVASAATDERDWTVLARP